MWQAGARFLIWSSWFFMTVSSRVVQGVSYASVVERDNITIICNAFGSAVTSWVGPDGSGQQIIYTNIGQTTILDSVPQKNRLYVQVNGGNITFMTLTIANAVKTDAGTYECNDGSEFSYTFVLKVTDPNGTVYVTQGRQSVIPCPLTSVIYSLEWSGPPGVTVYNSRGTTKLNIKGLPVDFVSRLAVHPTTGALIINNTQKSDDNLYKCNIGGLPNYVQLTVLVSPENPVITNTTDDIGSGRRVVRATEDNEVSLVCQVRGGNPQPSVKWLRGIVTGSEILVSNSSQRNADGTYDVTSTVIVIARRSEDRVTYVCQAEHRTWTSPQNASVELYLYLKPSEPVISDPGNLQENATMSSTCSISGCRPAANMMWSGAGTPITTNTEDKATETFNVTSTYKKTVTRQDNGAILQCTITHPALSSSLVMTKNITVWFSPRNVSISNNRQVTAGESLIIGCTTGVSNPAARITWKNGTIPLTGGQDVDQNGEYGGKIRYQELTIITNRYMDGNIITCTADNVRITGGGVSNSTVMDIKYHPIAAILNGSSITVLEGDLSVKLVCSAKSKPASSFTWKSGNSLLQYSGLLDENQDVFTITNVSRTHFGTYTCMANNSINPSGLATISINVLFPPTSVSISNNRQVTAGDSLILRCTTGVSNPAARIIWKNGTIPLSGGQDVDENGEHGGKVRYQELTIPINRHMDGNIITCTADNDRITGVGVSNSTIMDIKFSPIVTVSISPGMLVTEGTQDVMLRCAAWSKPTSHFKLTKENQTLPISELSGGDENDIVFTIATVNRTHAGIYSCLADNGVSGSLHERQKSMELLVQYPPDINITVNNVTTQDQKATLVCSPYGYPDNYTFGLWQHSWPGFNGTLRSLASDKTNKTATLELHNLASAEPHNLTYEDSGIYTCQASNGIRGIGASQEFIEQSVYLLVKSAPKILNIRENFGGGIGQSVPIQFDFYSNIEEDLRVTAKHSNSSDMSYQGTFQTVHLDSLTVQSFHVPAPGYRASLNISITSEKDFGQYKIEVRNIMGSCVQEVKIVAQSPPEKPRNFTHITEGEYQVSFSWMPGFHGGFNQTFVIEQSLNNSTWSNASTVEGGQSEDEFNITVKGLSPSTTYFFRIYAFNMIGRGNYSENLLKVSTLKVEVLPTKDDPTVAAVAWGLGAAVVVIIIIVVVLIIIRRKSFSTRKSSEEDLNRKRQEEERRWSGLVNNPVYDSSGSIPATSTGAIEPEHDVVVKAKSTAVKVEDNSNLYAQVNKANTKTKKGAAKGKDVKSRKGDVYENAELPVKNPNQGNLYENANKFASVTCLENIYEDTGASASNGEMVLKDGLLYADLMLPPPTTRNGKPVIRGIEDRTEYAEIAYGKRGQPLPDSDEEQEKS